MTTTFLNIEDPDSLREGLNKVDWDYINQGSQVIDYVCPLCGVRVPTPPNNMYLYKNKHIDHHVLVARVFQRLGKTT